MLMAGSAWADDSLIFSGIAKTLGAVMSVPGTVLSTATSGFPFGMIGSVVHGTVSAVENVVSGAFDLARGSAPYAKYAAIAAM